MVAGTFVFPLLYLASMGLGVGHLVSKHTGLVEGHTYLVFVAPCLLAITAMQSASMESTWPVLGAIKWVKTYHAAVATPLEPEDVVAGKIGWIAVQMLATGLIYTPVVALFGAALSWWVLLLPLVGVLTGLAFAGPLMAYATRAQSDMSFALIQRLLIIPMFLFSATYFPLWPVPLPAPLVQLMPLYHGVALSRTVAYGEGAWTSTVAHVVVLASLAGLGFWQSRRGLRARLVS
jgi:lipooligosaccharide transport system permease protein